MKRFEGIKKLDWYDKVKPDYCTDETRKLPRSYTDFDHYVKVATFSKCFTNKKETIYFNCTSDVMEDLAKMIGANNERNR